MWTAPQFTVVGLNPEGSLADNLYERKPLLPCPFSLAGASSPASFWLVRPRRRARAITAVKNC